MQMNVRHGKALNHNADAFGLSDFQNGFGQRFGQLEQARVQPWLEVKNIGFVDFWQQERVTWHVWVDVQDCQKAFVFPDFMGWERSLNDLAKHAIVHLESLLEVNHFFGHPAVHHHVLPGDKTRLF